MGQFLDDRQLLILLIKILNFPFMIRIKLIGELLLSTREYFVWPISQARDSTSNIKLRACMYFPLCTDVAKMHNVLILMTGVDDDMDD